MNTEYLITNKREDFLTLIQFMLKNHTEFKHHIDLTYLMSCAIRYSYNLPKDKTSIQCADEFRWFYTNNRINFETNEIICWLDENIISNIAPYDAPQIENL